MGRRPRFSFAGAGTRASGSLARERDRVDLDARVARQARGLHGRARRRLLRKELRVSLVHRREVVHVGQKDGRLDDARETRTGGLKHFREVAQDLRGLLADAALDEPPRRGVCRNLPRRVDEPARRDRLRVRPDGPRRPLCFDDASLCHESPLPQDCEQIADSNRRLPRTANVEAVRVWLEADGLPHTAPWTRSTSRTPGTLRMEDMTLSRCLRSKTSTVTSMRPRSSGATAAFEARMLVLMSLMAFVTSAIMPVRFSVMARSLTA